MPFVPDPPTDLAEGMERSSTPSQKGQFSAKGWNEATIEYDAEALACSIRQEVRHYKKEHLYAKILEYDNHIVDLERILRAIFGNEDGLFVDYSHIKRVVDLFKEKVVMKRNQLTMLEAEERQEENDEEDDQDESMS